MAVKSLTTLVPGVINASKLCLLSHFLPTYCAKLNICILFHTYTQACKLGYNISQGKHSTLFFVCINSGILIVIITLYTFSGAA
jgi:hypothetical protein